ncbi:hypothetical protein Gorai_007923 [Gossypium raimondii]|uniref:DUF4283 domain-containing protein n=1 Tax=Gossypium raimondii TaxID=29730 RepID=A0A7J8Q9D5_GOSRA|nr:hypothetical protein [Gossypium raimondii]
MKEELANLNLDDEEEELILCENDLNGLEDDYQFCLVDIKRVLDGIPWSFNRHLIVFHRLNNGEDLMKVPLVYINFWVQIYLAFRVISEGLARQLGHGEGFFPLRLTIGTQEVSFGWDISLRAHLQKKVPNESKWLREDGAKGFQGGSNHQSMDMNDQNVMGKEGNAIVQGAWKMDQRETIMENKLIGGCEGKKRQRPRDD